jgi:hypothetical protein
MDYMDAKIWCEFMRIKAAEGGGNENNHDAILLPSHTIGRADSGVVDVYTLGGRFVGHYLDGAPSTLPHGAYIVRGVQGVSKLIR